MNNIVSQFVNTCLNESDKLGHHIYLKTFPYLLILFIFMLLSLLFSIIKIRQMSKILSVLNHKIIDQ